jgi:carboxymethylenebutenolidase
MIEEPVANPTPDGIADGVLFRPDGDGRYPGVVHLTDLGGIRAAPVAMARRLADVGYVVLLPNAFYRTGRPPLFDFTPDFKDARTMARFGELAAPLTPDAMERDGAAYIDFLGAYPWVTSGQIGVVGYCFTGAFALRTAAARPSRVGVAASFHGGGLVNGTPLSPHLVLPRVRARLYFGHAENDRVMPQDAIDTLEHALERWGGRSESEVYKGAAHGWTVPDSPAYNETHADRAFAKLTALLATLSADAA